MKKLSPKEFVKQQGLQKKFEEDCNGALIYEMMEQYAEHLAKSTTVNLDNLMLLGKKDWTKDYGLEKVISSNPKNTEFSYYKREQSHRYLYALLGYMDGTKHEVVKYYDFPKDTLRFIEYVFNNVDQDFFLNGKKPEFHKMPFKKLYTEVWTKLKEGKTAYQI